MRRKGVLEDTICAIATPGGAGGIGIVRLSGPAAITVAEQITRLRAGRSLQNARPYMLHLADLQYPSGGFEGGDTAVSPSGGEGLVIDEALVVVMRGPRSYTAEDVVELHCHGNTRVLGQVCEACVRAGARLAQPGEFTKRAFLNGRLDLSQAEAVLDTIRAKSDAGLRAAQRQLRGVLGQQVNELRAALVSMLAQVEAGIDFVEEEITFVGRQELTAALSSMLDKIRRWLTTAQGGRVLREGARVVIVGRPNVGKSSLLNRLLQEERAIVTDVPGTTRDLIEESAVFDGMTLTLVDTAGLRDSDDVVEQEGIKRTAAARAQADLVLQVVEAGAMRSGETPDHCDWVGPASEARLLLINKIDLVDSGVAQSLIEAASRMANAPVIPISARTGQGLDEVRIAIRSRLCHDMLEPSDGVVVTNVRHATELARAATSLREAVMALERHQPPECVAIDLRGAAEALGHITGVITSDEVLHRIFSEFCIGK